jgi:hypothetical protein
VHFVGSTPYPDDAFECQVGRVLTGADECVLRGSRILICVRDTKWSATFRRTLADAGSLRRADTIPGAQLQCVCGALRSVGQGGVPESGRRPTCTERSPHSRGITTGNGITKVFTIG